MQEFSSDEVTIKEFRKHFESVATEATADGETVMSHRTMKATVSVYCQNDDSNYELVGIDVDQLLGCGCWNGVVLVVKKTDAR